jgi:hypothetical protein
MIHRVLSVHRIFLHILWQMSFSFTLYTDKFIVRNIFMGSRNSRTKMQQFVLHTFNIVYITSYHTHVLLPVKTVYREKNCTSKLHPIRYHTTANCTKLLDKWPSVGLVLKIFCFTAQKQIMLDHSLWLLDIYEKNTLQRLCRKGRKFNATK